MFFISPIKTLYSIKFYLQTLKESLWKAFGFIIYLFVLGAIFLTIYAPLKMQQPLNYGVEQFANYVPDIKVSDGIITANDNKRLVISPKELQGYKIIFDTASTEPAYPTQMQKENVMMYVNQNTIYVLANGQFQQNPVKKDFKFEVSKKTLLENKDQIVQFMSYFVTVIFILILVLRILMLAVLALIIAFIINAVTKANLGFKKLLTLALYLQGPVIILDFILLILPFNIIGINVFIALLIYVIYLNLIFFNLRASIVQEVEEQNEDKE